MNLPEPLPEITAALLADLEATLGRDLFGVYAYGSAISGGFDPSASDLDLCVVTARPIEAVDLALLQGVVDRLAARTPTWADRLDVVFVGRPTLAAFRDGGPLASVSHDEPLRRSDDAARWLQTWYLVRRAATPLAGPPPETVIPPISATEFTDAVAHHTLELARRAVTIDRPGLLAYVLLTLCRVLCLLDTRQQVPKPVAAAWLLERWPDAERAVHAAAEVSSAHGDRPLTSIERAEIRRQIAALGAEVEQRISSG